MSRMYRIAVAEGVSRVIHVNDGVTTQLEILEVVDKPTMKSLLEDELRRRGFKIEAGKATRTIDGVEVEVDTATGSVNAKVETKDTASVTVERSGQRDEDWDRAQGRGSRSKAEEALREQARAEGQKRLDEVEKREREKVTKRLEAALPGIQRLLDDVSGSVTREGLKVKAKTLGEIEEISESPNGDLTIKVRA